MATQTHTPGHIAWSNAKPPRLAAYQFRAPTGSAVLVEGYFVDAASEPVTPEIAMSVTNERDWTFDALYNAATGGADGIPAAAVGFVMTHSNGTMWFNLGGLTGYPVRTSTPRSHSLAAVTDHALFGMVNT